MINYLIIDSNVSSINEINNVLLDFIEFDCIGEIEDYHESMEVILKEMPQLIFINIDIISDNPFKFINEIKSYIDEDISFIAISKSKDMAYDTLKHNFFDYILTPILPLDIRKAALRLKKKYSLKSKKKLCLKSYKDYQYINTEDIIFLKADNNTTDFHLIDGRTISALKTLKIYENVLPVNFLRVHKSYIINQNFIDRVNYGKSKFSFKNVNIQVPFTTSYQDNIDTLMKSLTQLSILGSN
ncbi:LytR/AlgR family response regulator transcription factor [Pontimicrobium aquaticum]|uniref:DNA-binding response regulator n=1 Tax=Pontimicrobium aquaticum TaxID=2565367 RepID=A0A4U0EZP0_9FLAO|nr:LytTR family transcriptional regulator DNA-binding domain-containing protein [Pontimicrobium aquaticum]TJY37408.1 DNA-binding response regulator [Pontimicrobium aquaticum]